MLIFLFSNNLIGCAEQEDKISYKIESEFIPYVERFEQQIGVNVQMDISWGNLVDPIVGVCIKYTDGYKEIQINQTAWNNYEEFNKEEVIFHELGHCILDRDHDTNLITEYEIPKSIMYPYVLDRVYDDYRSYYLEELKNSETDWTLYF